jgi:dipeptidase E
MPYMGASAGSNVAGPNILTTNDWNVVALDRFGALGLVPFNINPHYKETDPAMAPYSETRDDRIREYHAVNANPVVGLEEGGWLVVQDGAVTVDGAARVKLFRRGEEPVWYQPGDRLPVR